MDSVVFQGVYSILLMILFAVQNQILQFSSIAES